MNFIRSELKKRLAGVILQSGTCRPTSSPFSLSLSFPWSWHCQIRRHRPQHMRRYQIHVWKPIRVLTYALSCQIFRAITYVAFDWPGGLLWFMVFTNTAAARDCQFAKMRKSLISETKKRKFFEEFLSLPNDIWGLMHNFHWDEVFLALNFPGMKFSSKLTYQSQSFIHFSNGNTNKE